MMRILLFLFTNVSVMMLLGSIISVLGYCSVGSNIKLMSIAGIVGLGGALISLLLSKSIALSTVRGVIVKKASNEVECWLLQTIYNYSKKLSIVAPQLVIYVSQDMNAFTTGARRDTALIAVSSGLLANMNRESIEAVIAHEMSHIVSGDMITMTLLQGIVNTFVIFISRSLVNAIYYWSSLMHNEENEPFVNTGSFNNINNSLIYMIISVILEFFFGAFASMIVFWFSRHREFYADAGAAKLVGCEKMIAALQELKYSCDAKKMVYSNISTFCINNVICNKKNSALLLCDLFSSHPSLNKRIKALQYRLYFKKSSYFF